MTRDIYPKEMEADHKAFLQSFFAAVDDAADEDLVNYFTDDATFILGKQQATGRQELLALFASLRAWASTRGHELDQVFMAPGTDSAMMKGTVEYGLVTGGTVATQWAGWAHLVRGDSVRIDRYQIFFASDAAF
ncbi:hypothetical protein NUU61_004625 [Penicillium alfredii]|uniref:SnoaL-like domain-containing protein n=1 Tax=Penicillium alfredii TaxID=1506179 RepID=A0A9W9KE51_9EURO|nr:uncharacterized protein NUU61_004625 [Penicillium alfredii]KAJ5102403.1 hypothetical protein NUU61_004625 [Penicillium alfredii]